jgi:tRNA dimethylallyltransferase
VQPLKEHKFLIVVAGPTAVGKTSLSISLARHFHTEIISADSRQFFKEISIGTAKPTAMEMNGIPHHFINSHNISEQYNAGKYEEQVMKLLPVLFEKHQLVFLVGGSGMYIKAVTDGMDLLPESEEHLRSELNAIKLEKGLDVLLQELKVKDPVYYEQVDKHNSQRIIRALEVIRLTGQTYSELRQKKKQTRPFQILKLGIFLDREELYKKIDLRMNAMLAQGLLEEAKAWYASKNANALQTVGYKEIYDFIDGKYNWDEAVRLLKRNSRRYAKRQMTWFRQDPEFTWFLPSQENEIIQFIEFHTNKPVHHS